MQLVSQLARRYTFVALVIVHVILGILPNWSKWLFVVGTASVTIGGGVIFREHEIVRYSVSGGASTVAYFSVFLWLTRKEVWYEISSAVAFLPSFLVSFVLYRTWTFEAANHRDAHLQMLAFLLKEGVFFGTNLIVLYLLIEKARLTTRFAQILSFVALSILGYFVTHWIFTAEISAHVSH